MRVYKKPIAQISVWSQLKGVYDGALILSKIGTAAGVLLLLIYCASNDTYPRGVGLGDVLSFILISLCFWFLFGVVSGVLIRSGSVTATLLNKFTCISRHLPKHLDLPLSPKHIDSAIFAPAIFLEAILLLPNEFTLTSIAISTVIFFAINVLATLFYIFCRGMTVRFCNADSETPKQYLGIDERVLISISLGSLVLCTILANPMLRAGLLDSTMRLANIRQESDAIEIFVDTRIAREIGLVAPEFETGKNHQSAPKEKGDIDSKTKIAGGVIFGKIGSYTTIRATPVAKDYEFPLAQVDPRSLALIKKSKGENLQKLYLNKDYIQKKILQIAYKSPTDKRALEDRYVEIDNAAVVDLTEETLTVRAVPVDFVVEIPNDKIVVTKRLRNAAG